MAIGARVLLVRAPVHARTLQRAVATGFGPRQPRNNREQRRGQRERGTALRANPGSYAIEIDPRHQTDRVRDHRLSYSPLLSSSGVS